MKVIRWIIYLPVALVAATLFSGIFNFLFQVWMPDWKILKPFSLFIWFGTGVVTSATWMAVGYKIAPRISQFVKWTLLIPLLILMILAFIGTVYFSTTIDVVGPVKAKTGQLLLSIGGFLTAFSFAFTKPALMDS